MWSSVLRNTLAITGLPRAQSPAPGNVLPIHPSGALILTSSNSVNICVNREYLDTSWIFEWTLETKCDYQLPISETETTWRPNAELKHNCASRIYRSTQVYEMKIKVEFTTIVKNHSANTHMINKKGKWTPWRHMRNRRYGSNHASPQH